MPRLAVRLLPGVAATAAGVALAAVLSAQTPQRPTFRTGVELVQVDVVVIDEQGNPVRGLMADDFTILDRRTPRPVEAFSEISHVRNDSRSVPVPPPDVRADVADNRSEQSERIVLLVIDDINIWVEREDLAKQMAHRVVDELGPQASMAVVFTSGRNSVEVTQDRAILHDAIDRFEGAFHRFRVNAACTPGSADFTSRDSFQDCQMFDSLEHIAKMVGVEDQRRKAVVVISEWKQVDTKGLFEVMQAGSDPVDSSMAYASGGGGEGMPPVWKPNYHEIELLQMMQAMHRGNVTMYGIDPRGRLQTAEERRREDRGESDDVPLRMNDPLYWSQEGLIETSEASGGFAIVDTNDLDAGLDRIVADLDNYYLLGFSPEDPADDSWHTIEVTVNRPGVTVRHRKGYQLGGEPEPPANDDPLVEAAAGVLPRTGLPLRLFAAPAVRDGNDARVAVTAEVRVPAARLERPGGRLEDSLTLTALAVNMKNQKVEEIERHAVDVVVPRSRVLPDGDVTYQLVFGLDLKPGAYQLRVSAESARMDETGSVYLTLTVPDVRDERVAIIGPTLGLAASDRSAAGMTLAEDGLLPAGLDPVLDRVFLPTEILRVHYQVWRRDERAEVRARLEVLDEAGRVVVFRDDVIGSRATGVVDVTVPLAGLPPGPYRVKISAGTREHEVGKEVGFAVRRER